MAIQTSTGTFDLSKFRFRLLPDLEAAVADPAIQIELDGYGELFYSIGMGEMAKDLEAVSPALQTAYQASKPFPSNLSIIQLIRLYGEFLSDALKATHSFRRNALTAIIHHQEALRVVMDPALPDDRKVQKCARLLSYNGIAASDMVTQSQHLANRVHVLINTSYDALQAVTNDRNVKETEKARVGETIAETKALYEKLTLESQELDNSLNEIYHQIHRAAKKAHHAAKYQRLMSVFKKAAPIAVSLVGSFFGIPPAFATAVAAAAGAVAAQPTEDEELEILGFDLGNVVKDLRTKLEQGLQGRGQKEVELAAVQAERGIRKAELHDAESQSTPDRSKIERLRRLEAEQAVLEERIKVALTKHDEMVTALRDELTATESSFEQEKVRWRGRKQELRAKAEQVQKLKGVVFTQLTDSVRRLRGLEDKSHTLQQAIVSLEVGLNSMLLVGDIFRTMDRFWAGAESQCRDLEVWARDLPVVTTEEFQWEGIRWLAFGKVNLEGYTTLQRVDRLFSVMMRTMPLTSALPLDLVRGHPFRVEREERLDLVRGHHIEVKRVERREGIVKERAHFFGRWEGLLHAAAAGPAVSAPEEPPSPIRVTEELDRSLALLKALQSKPVVATQIASLTEAGQHIVRLRERVYTLCTEKQQSLDQLFLETAHCATRYVEVTGDYDTAVSLGVGLTQEVTTFQSRLSWLQTIGIPYELKKVGQHGRHVAQHRIDLAKHQAELALIRDRLPIAAREKSDVEARMSALKDELEGLNLEKAVHLRKVAEVRDVLTGLKTVADRCIVLNREVEKTIKELRAEKRLDTICLDLVTSELEEMRPLLELPF